MYVNMYEHVYLYKIVLPFKPTQKFQEALSSTCHGLVYILTKKEIVIYIQIYIHIHMHEATNNKYARVCGKKY